MDVNDWRVLATVLGLVGFVALWVWAWSRKRRGAFDEAARLPFLDDDVGAENDQRPSAPGGDRRTTERRVS